MMAIITASIKSMQDPLTRSDQANINKVNLEICRTMDLLSRRQENFTALNHTIKSRPDLFSHRLYEEHLKTDNLHTSSPRRRNRFSVLAI